MDKAKDERELEEYLAKIRRTVSESEAMLASVELRLAETDAFLKSQGLTREEVLSWKPSGETLQAVNEELKRQGLPPVELDAEDGDFDMATRNVRAFEAEQTEIPLDAAEGEEGGLSERQRKFNNFMREYKL